MSSVRSLIAAGLCLGLTSIGAADVTITSADGRWVATIEDTGGGAGQATSLKDMFAAPVFQNSLSQTIHYVRLGGSLFFGNVETERMENLFKLMSFSSSTDAFTAVLVASDSPGHVAMVHGEMVPGNAGGLRVSLSFVDVQPPDQALFGTAVKPFVYVNLNVDGHMLSNAGNWSGDHFWQKSNASGTGNIRWFRGLNPDKHESFHDSLLQDSLDSGVTELSNIAWTGPGDINTAMSWETQSLGGGLVRTFAYAVGNQNITVPADFGLPPAGQYATITSADSRWHGDVSTTHGAYGPGAAGDFQAIRDLGSASPSFLFHTFNFLSTGVAPGAPFTKMRENFSPIGFFFAPQSARAYTSVLASDDFPGIIAIIDGKMLDGDAGGAVVCMKFVDTVGQTLFVKPVVVADMDVDNTLDNTGGFVNDHFVQTASPDLTGNVRWFRPASFETYLSEFVATLYFVIESGNSLPNTAASGPADLGAALGFHEWGLVKNQPYVIGFAIGNPNVSVPLDFCTPSIAPPCLGDFNGDGEIDGGDLGMLLAGWGSGESTDINGDGTTDGADLGLLLSAWGSCG